MAEKPKPKTKSSAKKTTKPTVMDVMKPGKSTPSASSRPIIVGHKVMTQDPMVNKTTSSDTPTPDETAGEKINVNRTGPKVIAPLSDTDKSEETKDTNPETPVETDVEASGGATEENPASTEGASEENAEETPAEEPASEEAPEEKQGEDKRSETEKESAQNAAMVNTVVEQADKNKKAKDGDDKMTELEQKRQAELDKLIEERKYYVPVAQVTKKRREIGLILFVVLLLSAVGTYLALDAQLVKNDLKLPYEFFKEQESIQTEQPVATVPDNSAPKEEVKKEAYTGKVIESAKKSFSLKVPDGWSIRLISSNDNLYSEFSGADIDSFLEYKTGTAPVVVTQADLGTDAPIRFMVNQFALAEKVQIVDDTFAKTEFTTDAGVKGTRYYKQMPLDMDGELGPSPAEKKYVYEFKTSTKKYYVVYRILEKTAGKEDGLTKSDKNRLELVENVVKSLVIK